MSGGYRVSLDIAKVALATSQNSLAVAGHNIANVSTPGFSRQTAPLVTRAPVTIGTMQYGSGVNVDEVMRHVDELLEERLLTQKSNYAASSEGVLYMDNLESLFNIQSDTNIDGLMSDFWNTWHDLSNNPDGTAERRVVYESGVLLSEYFNSLNADINQLETHITQEVENGVYQINNIIKQIAALNHEINHTETSAPANDQKDARATLVTQLSELMSVNVIDKQEQDGFLTILTDDGHPLVIGPETFPLEASAGRVNWITSGGGRVDISDEIQSGKISGWLEVKEEVIQGAKTELDILSKEIAWAVNSVHSQGVGQTYYSTNLSGTYAPSTNGLLSTLSYGNRIDYTKDFKMWVRDNQQPANATSLEIDMAVSDTTLSYVGGGAASANFQYNFTVSTSGTVGGGADNPVITWDKIDNSTYPPGATVAGGNVPVINSGAGNFVVDGMTFTINAGYLTAGNTYSINTSAANAPTPLNVTHDPTKRAGSVLDTYTFKIDSGGGDVTGVSAANPMVVLWESSYSSGTFTLDDPADLVVDVDGMELTFNSGILFTDEAFVISTNENGYPEDSTGAFNIETASTWHWTVDSFKDQFNVQATAAGVSVSANTMLSGSIEFVPVSGYTFAFSDSQAEDSGLMAALGVNTFFTGDNANTLGVNSAMADVQKIAAARIEGGDSNGMISNQAITDPATVNLVISVPNANNTITFEENGTLRTATLSNFTYSNTTDFKSLAADIQAQMDAASGLGAGTYKVEYDEIDNQFVISENDDSALTSLKIFWDLTPNTATALGFKPEAMTYLPPDGDYGISNNENSLLISEAQYQKTSVAKWTYERGSLGTSESVSAYSEEYYQTVISGLGISSAEFHQREDFGAIMVEKLVEKRDSISGVSIDEEMINLMLFQQSYQAASKLITTVDEMLTTLLGLK